MAATAAEMRRQRMATPTPEALEFVSFCHQHGVAPVPILQGTRRTAVTRRTVATWGHGWPLDVYDGGSWSPPRLCVWEDATIVLVTGHGPYSLDNPVDPADLPWWVGIERPSLADLLAKAASNILIKKENGTLRPPF